MKHLLTLVFACLVPSLPLFAQMVLTPTPNPEEKHCFTRQDLLARTPGFLRKLNVKEGATVKRGDIIAELDDRLIAAGVNEAKAGVSANRANLSLAKDSLRRLEKLKGSDSVSEQEIFVAKMKVEQAKAAVAAAEAVLQRTSVQYEDTKIRAALDGRVLGLPNVYGLFVQAGQSLGRIEVRGGPCQTPEQ